MRGHADKDSVDALSHPASHLYRGVAGEGAHCGIWGSRVEASPYCHFLLRLNNALRRAVFAADAKTKEKL